jgi:hypothetical protein
MPTRRSSTYVERKRTDLPVRRVVSMTYTENHQTQTDWIVGQVPSEWVWPFRHLRYDNMIARLQPA